MGEYDRRCGVTSLSVFTPKSRNMDVGCAMLSFPFLWFRVGGLSCSYRLASAVKVPEPAGQVHVIDTCPRKSKYPVLEASDPRNKRQGGTWGVQG